MLRSRLIIALVSVTLCLSAIGCDSSGKLEANRVSAYQACDEADTAFENKNYQVARIGYTRAIDSGNLNIDVSISAMIKRAVCSAALGDFAVAHADLDKVDQGPSEQSQVYTARSYVLNKEGKNKEAKAAWVKARRINREVQQFKD